jgi:hypothetical protein
LNPDPELLAALEAVAQFIEQVLENNRTLADALRAGRRPSDAVLREIDEKLAADRNELERLRLRVAQLKGQVRSH